MTPKQKQESAKLAASVVKGIGNVTERPNGSVITIHNADGKTVAQLVVGKTRVRLNVMSRPQATHGLTFSGKTWAGGCEVTAANAKSVAAVLQALAGKPAKNERKPRERKPQVERLAELAGGKTTPEEVPAA